MGLHSFIALVIYVVSSTALASTTAPLLEFWFFRPTVQIKDVHDRKERGDVSFGGNPQFIARGTIENLDATDIRWDDDALQVGSLSGFVSSTELRSETTVKALGVEKKMVLFSYPNVVIRVGAKAPLSIRFPDEISLKPVIEEGKVRFGLADDVLKTSIDSQIDDLFSDRRFDELFTSSIDGGLSEMAKQYAGKLLDAQRPQLLEQARVGLKRTLSGEELLKHLIVGAHALPPGLPALLFEENWVLRRMRSRRLVPETGREQEVVLWRLAPASAPKDFSPYRFPNVGEDSRNVMTVVSSPHLIELMIQAALRASGGESSLVLGETESDVLRRAFGMDTLEGPLEIVTVGDRGPRARPWFSSTSKSYLDILICLRSTKEPAQEFPLGAIFEFDEAKAPRLVNLVPRVGNPSPIAQEEAGWQELQRTLGKSLLQGLANSSIDDAHGRWMGASDKLVPLGIRSLGQGGLRGPDLTYGHWSSALAVDFELR